MSEVEITKAPKATINIDRHVDDSIIGRLDDTNYLRLGKSSCNRADLMLYAMAVGWDAKLPAKLERPSSGGFARTESFSPLVIAMVRLLHFANIGFDKPEGLRDVNAGYSYMEEYANGGFNLIEGDLDSRLDSEEKANLIIAELDGRYEKWFG